jgi:uncharacterized protein (DUF362 family)
MRLFFTRRNFLTTGVGALVTAAELRAQSEAIPVAGVPVKEYKPRSTVALAAGEDRRKTVYQALLAIDDQILPKLKTKKRVLIKPNDVNPSNQLACTHADALRGILDYLAPRFKGQVTIGEVLGGGFRAFQGLQYPDVIKEYNNRFRGIELVDFTEQNKFVTQPLLDQDAHVVPVHLAEAFFDPDAFIMGSAMLKSHNYAVVTMSIKNMVLGAPARTEKAYYHAGFHLIHYNMLVTAQAMQPFWGATVIDGHEGMEGNGPSQGIPVASRLAIASTDFVAADRVGVECMGVDPKWVGYLRYCGQVGLGNYDLAKIDIRGPEIATVQKKYQLASDVDRQLAWMTPLDVEDGSWIGPKGRRTDRRPPAPPPAI